MSARLDITRAQVKAIAIAAKECGCTVEVERKGTIYRVIPDIHRKPPPKEVDDEEDFEL